MHSQTGERDVFTALQAFLFQFRLYTKDICISLIAHYKLIAQYKVSDCIMAVPIVKVGMVIKNLNVK